MRQAAAREQFDDERKLVEDLEVCDLGPAASAMTQILDLAKQGRQREAKLAIQNVQSYSLSDRALNEDARVQLRNLRVQQAMVALVNRRDSVRPRQGSGLIEPRDGQEAGADFTPDAAERVLNSLGREETESLQTIADRMYDQQTAAEKFNWPLHIDVALRGRMLRFEREMQVKPDVGMVDYVTTVGQQIVPVEVKAGKTGTLKSLHAFLTEKGRNLGLRFNSDRPSLLDAKTSIAAGANRPFLGTARSCRQGHSSL